MISREKWKEIALQFENYLLASAVFRYKKHLITVQKCQVGENKLRIVVYLDGRIEGRWTTLNSESPDYNILATLFWKRKKHLLSPFFKTATSFKKQFCRIHELELVKLNGNKLELIGAVA